MENHHSNAVKLGVFALSGLLFLVLLLYMIGRNSNLFGDTYQLRARFDNIQGLMAGNNIRYAGIETGTVKSIRILNDTVIEVTMVLEKRMKNIIRKNAQAAIGTEGLVGNKVVNIFPSREPADLAEEGDLLVTAVSVNTDDMLQSLQQTNQDIGVITAQLKTTMQRINDSKALWQMLQDSTLPHHVQASLANIHRMTAVTSQVAGAMHDMIRDVKSGEGTLGQLITDTAIVHDLKVALHEMQQIGIQADAIGHEVSALLQNIQHSVNEGKGSVPMLLHDAQTARSIQESLANIEEGTERFNENMEAMKHNFLFRGYFKKQEREKRKAIGK